MARLEDHLADGGRGLAAGQRVLTPDGSAATTGERLNVLGVGVDAVDLPAAVGRIEDCIRRRRPGFYVTVTGVHGVMEAVRDDAVRSAHNRAELVVPDGMPLVWLLRLAGHRDAGRVVGRDLMLALFRRSQSAGYRHFLYGSTPETLQLLESRLAEVCPQAAIVGRYAPPFRPAGSAEDAAVIAAIDSSRADILWVGLSTPKQELWMADHRARLGVPVLIGVGAAFDYLAGRLQPAPKLLQRAGLEWAFRLAMEPRRLAGRYLRNNPAFLWLMLIQKLRLRNFPLG